MTRTHETATTEPVGAPAELAALHDDVVLTVRHWLAASAEEPADRSAARLAGMLEDEGGLDFTVAFVDRVIRPEDPRVAAANLAELARRTPRFVPFHLRLALALGALAGRVVPRLVIPVVRRALRQLVGHLVLDARPRPLTRAVRKIRATGADLNINLLGEMVMGRGEAGRRLAETRRLLARSDVDYVSVKVSSTVAPHSPWAFDEAVEHIVDALSPLFRDASTASPAKFVNLDMEEYHDLRLTVAVFRRLLDQDEFRGLRAGLVLQAYLPDALATMIELQEWAARRVASGGAPIKVRVVKGANLPMERVEAELHGWPLATWSSKRETDTNYKRVLDYALHPDRAGNVQVGVAGHNLFDVALAWHVAKRRGVTEHVDFEMLLGMAPGQAAAVRRDVGGLLLYVPVVRPEQFDVAIAYLVRRLEEGASSDNFMSAVFAVHEDEALFERERARFAESLHALDGAVPEPHRRRDDDPDAAAQLAGFANAADTDPSVPASLSWGRSVLERAATSTLGADDVAATTVTEAGVLESEISRAVGAAGSWGSRTGVERGAVLRRAAVELERRRGELCEVMAAECGKTIDQADPEVSEAVDFANYYATLAEGLDAVDGARHVPVPLTVVTPPWNFPVAIPTGSTIAALAAGSAVLIKPAPQAVRCAAVMVAALHAAGVPTDALRMVNIAEGDLSRSLIADPRVGRVILTGGYETAEIFRGFRPDLPLLAETSGKNAIVVTPTADLDLAVRDIVHSAFAHAGQKCSAASLVILVGSLARSQRLRTQLVDAVESLRVGLPTDPTSQVGPLVSPAEGKLRTALTTLDADERWLVEPRPLDDTGRLWSPGVKAGVTPGSAFHLTEYFGPVLGIMTADSLDEAIELQNAVPYGLTAGLHSLDEHEIARWLERVQAGNLYVNRGITGAIVRRQPFGGWKRSAVGAGTKAGGPNYLVGLSDWRTAEASATAPVSADQRRLLAAGRDAGLDVTRLERALASDALAVRDEFGTSRDVSGLSAERDVLRYRPVPVTVRAAAGVDPLDVVRVAAGGIVTGAGVTCSLAESLPDPLARSLTGLGVTVHVEDDAAWRDRLTSLRETRVRVLGPADVTWSVLEGRADVAVYDQPVTEAGRVELLPFLHEQAVSITAHRFGTPDAMIAALPV